jgi:hypothetical protein
MTDQTPTTSTTRPHKGKGVDVKEPKPQATFNPSLNSHSALKLSSTIEKLKPPGPESNYLDWSWVLDMHFNTTGVRYIVNPAVPNPPDSPSFAWTMVLFAASLLRRLNLLTSNLFAT